MKIRKNDEVIVISGSEKGKTGRVLNVNPKAQTVTINKINIKKKHVKPSQTNPDGGIQEFEAPIHISNVSISVKLGKEKNSPSRVGYDKKEGKKIRIAKKNGKAI
ncbi:MAG: 50S ribosomal protein L24 [Mycoplasma sp.]|nr:50S ribosomal protein L24 [Mycoplasma sp.]